MEVVSSEVSIRTGAEKSATVRWEIATGQETILQEDPLSALAGPSLVSLDERWLFRHNQQDIEVRPVSGGESPTRAATVDSECRPTIVDIELLRSPPSRLDRPVAPTGQSSGNVEHLGSHGSPLSLIGCQQLIGRFATKHTRELPS